MPTAPFSVLPALHIKAMWIRFISFTFTHCRGHSRFIRPHLSWSVHIPTMPLHTPHGPSVSDPPPRIQFHHEQRSARSVHIYHSVSSHRSHCLFVSARSPFKSHMVRSHPCVVRSHLHVARSHPMVAPFTSPVARSHPHVGRSHPTRGPFTSVPTLTGPSHC